MSSSNRTTKNKNNESPKSLIYVGPKIKGLTRYSSFIGGYPKIHEEHKEQCPALTKMFIEPVQLPEVEQKLRNQNSAESIFYSQVEKYFSEVK